MEIILPQEVHNAQKFLDCAEQLDYDEFSAVSDCVLYLLAMG